MIELHEIIRLTNEMDHKIDDLKTLTKAELLGLCDYWLFRTKSKTMEDQMQHKNWHLWWRRWHEMKVVYEFCVFVNVYHWCLVSDYWQIELIKQARTGQQTLQCFTLACKTIILQWLVIRYWALIVLTIIVSIPLIHAQTAATEHVKTPNKWITIAML